jgi:small subunit ribosomal protein S24e
MDIEITDKKNNPLFNRTEIHFTINHEGEGTPNREIIRSEIAEKLNVKKENIIINNISSSFGIQKSRGYAKIYTSPKKLENLENKYILNRNKTIKKEKKKEEEIKKPEKEEVKAETDKDEKTNTEQKDEKVENSDKIEKTEVKNNDTESDSKKINK